MLWILCCVCEFGCGGGGYGENGDKIFGDEVVVGV